MRPNIYPLNRKVGHRNIWNCPLMDCLQDANIEIKEKDGLDFVKQYIDDKHTMLFLDLPYILGCNAMHKSKSMDTYKFFSKQDFTSFSFHMLICSLSTNYSLILKTLIFMTQHMKRSRLKLNILFIASNFCDNSNDTLV